MSCVVMRVFDAVLETEALAAKHPSLVSCLDTAMARVLALAREVVNASENAGGEVPALTSTPTTSSSSSLTGKNDDEGEDGTELVVAQDTFMDDSQMQMYMPSLDDDLPPLEFPADTTSSSIVADSLFPSSHPELFEAPFLSAPWPSYTSPSSSASTPSQTFPMPPQIFGNGWSTQKNELPALTLNGPILAPTLQIRNRLQALGSFPQRLVESTISHGYSSLINADTVPEAAVEVDRAFRYTLRFRTRSQMVDNLQWLLGPGREYIYRASGYTWGSRDGTRAVFPKGFSPAPRMRDLLVGEYLEEYDGEEEPEFLTVIGVHDELQNLGAKLVDNDTIEIIISQSRPAKHIGLGMDHLSAQPDQQPSSPSPESGTPSASSATDAFMDGTGSLFGFFLTHRRETNLTLRLNMTMLIANLSRISTCFVRGPGYPRHELGRVIQASVVTAHWS